MIAMLPHVASSTPPPSGHILERHHREIEEACLALLAACTGDPGDLARRWGEIEYQLYDHMMAEEHFLFSAYQHDDPEIAQDLRDQHARLREQALEIGVAAELHAVHWEQIEAFVAALRAHDQHEEATLYRWADGHLAGDDCHRMRVYLAAG